MTGPRLPDLLTAYTAWIAAPTRTRRLNAREPGAPGPRELDIHAFEEAGDSPIAFIATAGMSSHEVAGPAPHIELVLAISATIDDDQFAALARRLGELAAVPFRERSFFAPNMVVGPFALPLFDGKPFLLLSDFNVRSADYLPTEPAARLLRITPLTETEAQVARDLGDVDVFRRLARDGINGQDPHRPEADLRSLPAKVPVPVADDAVVALWDDIDGWLAQHAPPTHQALRPGASDIAIADLERTVGVPLPGPYRASLKRHDGRAYLTDYEYLSIRQVAQIWTIKKQAFDDGVFTGRDVFEKGGGMIRNFWWHPGWIPFAEDSAGNLMCIDMAPGWQGMRGQIVRWERDAGPYGGREPSFYAWLTTYRDDLLDGRRYEVDASGLIAIRP